MQKTVTCYQLWFSRNKYIKCYRLKWKPPKSSSRFRSWDLLRFLRWLKRGFSGIVGNFSTFSAGFSATSFDRASLEDDLLSLSCFLNAAGDCDQGSKYKNAEMGLISEKILFQTFLFETHYEPKVTKSFPKIDLHTHNPISWWEIRHFKKLKYLDTLTVARLHCSYQHIESYCEFPHYRTIFHCLKSATLVNLAESESK